MRPHIIIVVVTVASVWGDFGCENGVKHGIATTDAPVITISATKLFREYRDTENILSLDQKYAGKTILVTEVTGQVHKDRTGRYYLSAAEDERVNASGSYPGVILYVGNPSDTSWASLPKTIAVVGVCKGSQSESVTQEGRYVLFEQCRLSAAPVKTESRIAKCAKCGAETKLGTGQGSFSCEKCGAKNTIKQKAN